MVNVIIKNPEVCDGTFYLNLTLDQCNLLEFLQHHGLLDNSVEFEVIDIDDFHRV